MLSGVTRGACPPVYPDKATGNRAQFRPGHSGETHAYIRQCNHSDWFLSQCVQGLWQSCWLHEVWLEHISQASQPFTARTCTFSYLKHYSTAAMMGTLLFHCGDVTEAEYWPFACKCTTVDVEAHYSSNTMTQYNIILPDSPSFLNS